MIAPIMVAHRLPCSLLRIIIENYRKHFNQFTMSCMFCVIMCYEISFPLFFPLSVLVMPYGKI